MTDYALRVSSTPLGAFLTCPRKFVYSLSRPFELNRAMAMGTIFHAIQEYRLLNEGRWPSKRAVYAMKGNYDDPKHALIHFPDVWGPAMIMAQEAPIEEVLPPAPIDPEHRIVEFALDALDLRACDGEVKIGGYLDVFDKHTRTIRDWKTRGSLQYAPETIQDFLDNPQLVYYASAVAHKFDWPDVTVQHLNVTRPRGKSNFVQVKPISQILPRWFLEEAWAVFQGEILPAMYEAWKTAQAHGEDYVPRAGGEACFTYGPCQHIRNCPVQKVDGESTLARLQRTYEEAGK